MSTLLVHIAILAYAGGAAAFLTWLLRPRPRFALAGRLLLVAGLAAHVGSLVAGAASESTLARIGLGGGEWRTGQLFSITAAVVVAAWLALDLRFRMPVAGAFVAPFAVVILVPAHLVAGAPHAVAEPLQHSAALVLHVGAASLGTGMLALAFALALLYLASERQVKEKRLGRFFSRLPSLELLDRVGYHLAVWGFGFLSVAIATGSLVSREADGPLMPFAPKEAFAVLAWLLFASMIQARLIAGWRGRRVALLVVTGFVLLAGCYVGLIHAASGLPARPAGLGT